MTRRERQVIAITVCEVIMEICTEATKTANDQEYVAGRSMVLGVLHLFGNAALKVKGRYL